MMVEPHIACLDVDRRDRLRAGVRLSALSTWIRRLAVLACVASMLSGPAAAQAIMVDLGAEVVVLTPDATVALPVTLSLTGEGPAQIVLDVGYPGDMMTFIEAQPGFSVEASDGEVRAQPAAAEAGTDQVLTVDVQAKKPMTAGTLATLKFGFTSAAKPGTELPIRNLRRSAKSATGADMATRGTEGLITLVEPPAPCFFYMH